LTVSAGFSELPFEVRATDLEDGDKRSDECDQANLHLKSSRE